MNRTQAATNHHDSLPPTLGDKADAAIDSIRTVAETARERAARAGDRTVGYIQDEPVKAVLIAAAAGAAMAALVGAIGRHRGGERG